MTLKTEILPAPVGLKMRRVLRKIQERRRRRWLIQAMNGYTHKKIWLPLSPKNEQCFNVDGSLRCTFPVPVSQQVAAYRSYGVRVKFQKRRVLRRVSVPLWIESTETVRDGRRRGGTKVETRWERAGVEKDMVFASWHSVESLQLIKLRDFLMRQHQRGVDEASLPF